MLRHFKSCLMNVRLHFLWSPPLWAPCSRQFCHWLLSASFPALPPDSPIPEGLSDKQGRELSKGSCQGPGCLPVPTLAAKGWHSGPLVQASPWSLALGHGSFPSPHPEHPFWHSALEPQPAGIPASPSLQGTWRSSWGAQTMPAAAGCQRSTVGSGLEMPWVLTPLCCPSREEGSPAHPVRRVQGQTDPGQPHQGGGSPEGSPDW